MGRAFLLLLCAATAQAALESCKFLNPEDYYVKTTTSTRGGDSLMNIRVSPPDAKLVIANVRAEQFPEQNWTPQFRIDPTLEEGLFELRALSTLYLPVYPSSINETNLYVTVVCNDYAHPLITIHLKKTNVFSPQFYYEPYVVAIPKGLPVGTILNTPVSVIDWDPAPIYNLSFWLEDAHKGFEVVPKTPLSKMLEDTAQDWPLPQKPRSFQLRINDAAYKLPVSLKLIVSDNDIPPRKATTIINLTEELPKPTVATTTSRVTELPTTTTTATTTTSVETTTATTTVAVKTTTTPIPKTEKLKKPEPEKAFGTKTQESSPIASEDLENNVLTSEDPVVPVTAGATRFEQCVKRVTLPENSKRGSIITPLEIMNKREDTVLELIDPDGTFAIAQDELIVADPRLIDRERFSSLEVVISIKGSNQWTQCTRIRVKIDLLDENDNRPVFEKEEYWFPISSEFHAGGQIGKVLAQDIDLDANGQITYSIVNPDASPFTVVTQGRHGVLYTNSPLVKGVEVYNLTVEAKDHGEPRKSVTVPVSILVLLSQEEKASAAKEKDLKAKAEAAATVTLATPVDVPSVEEVEVGESVENIETTSQEESPFDVTTTTVAAPRSSHPTLTNMEMFIEKENELEESTETPGVFSFKRSSYVYDVFGENIEEGSVIGHVDAEPNAEFYAIDKNAAKMVKITDYGDIVAGKELAAMPANNLTFGVSATNGLDTARTQVTIWREPTLDPTEAAPRFDQETYRFRVTENQRPEVIGLTRAFHSAISSSESIKLTYSLVTPANEDELPFEVHAQSGEISTSRPLDAEQSRKYRFMVRACLTQNVCSSATVIVLVDDVNDNSPTFSQRTFTATVSSDLPIGSIVAILEAKDTDFGLNSQLTYSIAPASPLFKVNAENGEVRTTGQLTQPVYNLLVLVTDNGVPRRQDTAELRVQVQGTNPSSPVFDKESYSIVMEAPIRAGQTVGKVHASDPDPGPEGLVSYSFAPTTDKFSIEDQNKFSINSKTGVITALQTIPLGEGPFRFSISASDNGKNTRRTASSTLTIEVVESKSLRFLPLPTTVFISTEKAVGSVVIRVSASTTEDLPIRFRVLQENSQFVMDADLLRVANHLMEGDTSLTIRAENGISHIDHQLKVVVMSNRDKYPVFPHLTYDFEIQAEGKFPRTVHQFNAKISKGTLKYSFFPPTAPPQGLFLDEITGDLLVTSNYPKVAENRETVFVVIRASNIEFPEFYSDVGVALTLISNNPTLRFDQSIYRLEVFENTPVGKPIGRVGINTTAFPDTRFSINPESLVGINQNGEIVVSEPIDIEALEEFTSNYVITAKSGTDSAKTRLQLTVRDVNEFPPVFVDREPALRVSQSALPGTPIGKTEAFDKDVSEKDRLIYRVVGGSGKNLVFIQEDGTLIVGDRPLPSENFDLEVEVVDRNGNTDRAHVVVDVESINDHEPKILDVPLIWKITEGTTEVFTVRALDEDSGPNGEATFAIVEGNESGHFELTKGRTKNTANIRMVSDRTSKKQSEYVLTIEARDNGTPSRSSFAHLKIQVSNKNDFAPQFGHNEYTQKIQTDMPVGETILTVTATDRDRDQLMFSIQGGSCDNFLQVDSEGKVSLKVPLGPGNLVCLVAVSDGEHTTHASIKLTVEQPTTPSPQSSNHAPEFDQKVYSATMEKGDVRMPILKVHVVDPDQDPVVLTIEPPQYRNLFAVSPQGDITLVVDPSDLEQSSYSFLVVAEDRGTPLLSSFTSVKIEISPESGNQLDGPVTTVETTRSEFGRQSTRPQIQFSEPSYHWTIEENMPVGTVVGQVATSTAHPNVEYSFVSTTGLQVDANGRVAVMRPIDKKIEDMVIATIGSEILAEARVYLEVVKSSTTTSLLMTTTPVTETTTTTVSTTTESTTTEEPVETTPNTVIVESTRVTTKGPTKPTLPTILVDGEHRATTEQPLPTPVRSTTFGLPQPTPTVAFVTPMVVDSSAETMVTFAFELPAYHAVVSEGNYQNGLEVEVLPKPFATNSRQPVVYSIEDTTTKMPFLITEDGKLIVFELDREQTSGFVFSVLAKTRLPTGQEISARSRMNLTVLDANDNAPVFESHPDVIGLPRNLYEGTPVYHIVAHDLDAQSRITYEMTPTSHFVIDPREGMIRVSKDLRTAQDDMELVIVASDNGRPATKTETKLLIRLFDDGDKPHLPAESPEVIVTSRAKVGTQIAQLLAGPSVSENDKIMYRLENDSDGLFAVRDNGVIVLTRQPGPGQVNQYHQLTVMAENSKGMDKTNLNVYVEGSVSVTTPSPSSLDTCTFEKKIYKAEIMENQPEGSHVATVESRCATQPGRLFRYAFHYPTDDFSIDAHSGEIRTKTKLDREKKNYHLLHVNVIEQNPRRRRRRQAESLIQQTAAKLTAWQTLVVVTVLDENDNAPTFLQHQLSAVVDENAIPGTPVIRLQARDLDAEPPLQFLLQPADEFKINATNGLISLAEPLAENSEVEFPLSVTVTDGVHEQKQQLMIYKLGLDVNLVQITEDVPLTDVDPSTIERKLTEMCDVDTRVLVAQAYRDDEGVTDAKRTHLFVYALEDGSRKPLDREDLKRKLMEHMTELSSALKVSSIALISTDGEGLSSRTVLAGVLFALLLALLMFLCCLIVVCMKRTPKNRLTAQASYMIDSAGPGPRPYDVENVPRATAQNVLAGRPLPDPKEHLVELAVSPAFLPTDTNRGETLKEFNNSIRERPSSLLQSALARHKVHGEPTPILHSQK